VHSFVHKVLHGVDCLPSVRELSRLTKKDQKHGDGCSAKLWHLLGSLGLRDESRSPNISLTAALNHPVISDKLRAEFVAA
jgi:hypothetical protein